MTFPKFLRIATNAKINTADGNSTEGFSRTTIETKFFMLTNIFAKTLGFTYTLLSPQDGEIGTKFPNGSWTGLVGMIHRNEVDMAVSMMQITTERAKAVTFSYPYYSARITFVTRKAEYEPEFSAFLKPYSVEVWFFISVCFITMPLLLTLLFRKKYRLKSLIWDIFKTFIDQGIDIKPKKTGDYVVMICWIAATGILGYSYKALLLSFLTFPPLKHIRTIPELANAVTKGEYQCSTYPRVMIPELLMRSTDPNRRLIGRNLKKNNGSNSVFSVLNNKKSEKKPAFLDGFNHLDPLRGTYIVSEEELVQGYHGLPMRKDFCCKAQIDRQIGYIWAYGLFQKLIDEESFLFFLRNIIQSPESLHEEKTRDLSLDDLKGVFVILIIGYLLSTLIFILEVITYKIKMLVISRQKSAPASLSPEL